MRTAPRSLVLLWLLALVGFPIGGFLGHLLAGRAATVPAALLSGLLAGAIIGLGQALALRLRVRELAMWVGVTGAGLAVALGVTTAAIGQVATMGEAIALGGRSGLLIPAHLTIIIGSWCGDGVR